MRHENRPTAWCSLLTRAGWSFQSALKGSTEARTRVWRALRACGKDLSTVRDVTLEGDLRVFDWEQLTFSVRPSAATLGPLAVGDAVASD